MADFEQQLVQAYNTFFNKRQLPHPKGAGIAKRRKQAQYTSQPCDIEVYQPNTQTRFATNCLAIECKTKKMKSSTKLYWTRDFSESDNTHQIESMKQYLEKTGMKGSLAVSLRRGRGRNKHAYLIPFQYVYNKYTEDGFKGLDLEHIHETRQNTIYQIPRYDGEWHIQKQHCPRNAPVKIE